MGKYKNIYYSIIDAFFWVIIWGAFKVVRLKKL